MFSVVYSMQNMKFSVILFSEISLVSGFWQIECEMMQIMFGLGVSIMVSEISVKVNRLESVGMGGFGSGCGVVQCCLYGVWFKIVVFYIEVFL